MILLKKASHKIFCTYFLISTVFAFSFFCTSTLTIAQDSTYTSNHSVKLAWMMSAVVPGAGQIYNKKYWKMPVIYVAAGTIAYFYVDNQKTFRLYQDELIYRKINGVPSESLAALSDQIVTGERDRFRRYRDWNVLFFLGLYLINVVDATVDAYFFDFDVSDDLSLRIEPTIIPYRYEAFNSSLGVRCVVNF